MYKKILWLSALIACVITVFFAIFGFTKVNQNAITLETSNTHNRLAALPITDKDNQEEHGSHIQPRLLKSMHKAHENKCCDKDNKDKDKCCEKDKMPKEEQKDENTDDKKQTKDIKREMHSKHVVKEMADDSTEDNFFTAPHFLQQRHLPHVNAGQRELFYKFLQPFIIGNMPNRAFEDGNTFDLKFKNAFTIEIVENRDDSGWHFYINGQEVQPNNNTEMTPDNSMQQPNSNNDNLPSQPENAPDTPNSPNTLPENQDNNLENTPMILPELDENRPNTENNQSNTPIPDETNPNPQPENTVQIEEDKKPNATENQTENDNNTEADS